MAVTFLIGIAYAVVGFAVAVLLLYAIRHYLLGYSRLRIENPKDAMELVGFHMPPVTVLIPMHNEERVAGDILQAIVDSDYDWEMLEVIPINDRSEDKTQEIIDAFALRYPFIQPLHRTGGPSGKPAALVEACRRAADEILAMFDLAGVYKLVAYGGGPPPRLSVAQRLHLSEGQVLTSNDRPGRPYFSCAVSV